MRAWDAEPCRQLASTASKKQKTFTIHTYILFIFLKSDGSAGN
jgi:hypothetical protein